MTNWVYKGFPLIFLASALFTGCTSHIAWVTEPNTPRSCVPDAPPTWKDYTPQQWDSAHSAQTAVRFRILSSQPPRLQAQFDHNNSLVKPQIVENEYPVNQKSRQRLLRHEQLHFAISCLLTRQANATLQTGDDPHKMLLLLRATAQRLNLEYDEETHHGTIRYKQIQWEKDVEQQLQEVSLSP